MKRPLLLFLAALCVTLCAALTLVSCGKSKAELESELVRCFQEEFDTDDDFKRYEMKATGASLVKADSHTYTGFVTVRLDDKSHNIGVTVTSDGEDFIYNTEPFAFAFLAERAIDDLFDGGIFDSDLFDSDLFDGGSFDW